MASVRVEPLGVEFDIKDDESVMAAAERNGYAWPTVCGGEASCKVCTLEIEKGAEAFSEMSVMEREEIVRSFGRTERMGRGLRLACQARVTGDVVVHKRGVRPRPVD